MCRVQKNSPLVSLSKLKLALAALSSGAALVAASSFAHAQQSEIQACNAGEILVAARVDNMSESTSTDANGTPIVIGCAQPRSQATAFRPFGHQPLQCPSGMVLIVTQVRDPSQTTAVDQDGNSFFVSCALGEGFAPAPVVRPWSGSYRHAFAIPEAGKPLWRSSGLAQSPPMKEMHARSGGGTADNGDGRGGGARLKDRKAPRMLKRGLSCTLVQAAVDKVQATCLHPAAFAYVDVSIRLTPFDGDQ
jgi:hypothetical protein